MLKSTVIRVPPAVSASTVVCSLKHISLSDDVHSSFSMVNGPCVGLGSISRNRRIFVSHFHHRNSSNDTTRIVCKATRATTRHLQTTHTVDFMEEPPRILSSLQQQQHSAQGCAHKPLMPLKHVRGTTVSSTGTQAVIGAPITQSLCPSLETKTTLPPQTVGPPPSSSGATPLSTTAKPVPLTVRNALEHERILLR